jgi:SOS response associated peptidase (SRAP)
MREMLGSMEAALRDTLADRGLMALAGLWENWKSPEGEWMRSFAIITTTPNELCAQATQSHARGSETRRLAGLARRAAGGGIRAQGPVEADPLGRDDLLARERAGAGIVAYSDRLEPGGLAAAIK